MRWVFIRPARQSTYYDPEIQEPLGIEYLAACRSAAGDKVLLLDCAMDRLTNVKLARRAAAFQPDIIGFSLTTADEINSACKIYDECSEALAGRPVSWLAGGNFVSTEPDLALRLLPAPIQLIQFEGEEALASLAASWERQLTDTGNSLLHEPKERVIVGTPVYQLDTLPFAERRYAQSVLSNDWAFNLQGSRGCFGACRYCASPGMSTLAGARWRGRPPEHVVEEMALLCAHYGVRSFNFVDEDFLGPDRVAEERARAFAAEIKRRKLNIAFSIQVRPASLNHRIIRMLTSAGLIYVFMGIESDNPDDLSRWRRPQITNAWQYVQHFRTRGAEVNAGVMLFHPHATLEGIERFAQRLHNHRLLEYRSAINRLDAMPGSYYYCQSMTDGKLDASVAGPQPLSFEDPSVQFLYDDLLAALAPLGPPSMHALCAVPVLLSRQRIQSKTETKLRALRNIMETLDGAVADTLFSLLARHQAGSTLNGQVAELRCRNLAVAERGAHRLVTRGFAPSYEELREAIRLDSGM